MGKRTATGVLVTAGVLALVACGGTGSSEGGGSETLRVGAYLPETHPGSISGDQYFIEQAEELSGGALDLELYPAQQLGKSSDLLDLTTAGTADIGMVAPAYVPDQLPVSSVGELPAMYDSACVGSEVFHELTQPGGYLYETEFKPAGLRPLFGVMTTPYEVMSVSKPLDDLEAVAGLKLKTAGGAADTTARLLGSTPVQITNSDIYSALERGTVDGRYGTYEYMPAVNSEDLLQNGTLGAQVAGFAMTASISEKVWNSLSEDAQQALTEAGERTVEHFCTEAESNDADVRKQLVEDHGWTVYELDDEEQDRWHDTMAPVRDQWATQLNESKGNSAATKALEAWDDSLETHEGE